MVIHEGFMVTIHRDFVVTHRDLMVINRDLANKNVEIFMGIID